MSSCAGNRPVLGKIESVRDIFTSVRVAGDKKRWYRGQSNEDYELKPKAFRPEFLEASEKEMLDEFRQKACLISGHHPIDDWGWIVLAQHYGLPTRLLDWSDNPLQGLYFACQKAHGDEDFKINGKLFVLEPRKMNERAMGKSQPFPLILEEAEDKCKDYLPGNTHSGGSDPIAVVAMDDFPRIGAQNGCFTVCSDRNYRYDDPSSELIAEYVIPHDKKEGILEELEFVGVNVASTYPDLDHLAEKISNDNMKPESR